MPTFKVTERRACYVDFVRTVDADSEEHALELHTEGAGEVEMEVGDEINWVTGGDITVTQED